MKNLNIENGDLKTLFIHTRHAYGNMTFDNWVLQCKNDYDKYVMGSTYCKTFSQWVNGQIIALTS